jgi:hypothetical protein
MSGSLGLSVDLVETQSEIASKILQALLPDVSRYFDNVQKQLIDIIPNIIIDSIVNQPEYDALIGGTLQYEFGLPDPSSRLSEILETIRNGHVVKYKPVNIKSSSLAGGIKIEMVKKDFGDLLSLGSASLVTEKGEKLDWLKWLLIEGDNVIVSDHVFIFGASQYSRTGYGVMRQVGGGFWRVPPEYAGNMQNNWITRAIEAASSQIDKEIQRLLTI